MQGTPVGSIKCALQQLTQVPVQQRLKVTRTGPAPQGRIPDPCGSPEPADGVPSTEGPGIEGPQRAGQADPVATEVEMMPRRRLRPRTSLWLSVALTGLFLALLTLACVSALAAAAWGDRCDLLWGTWPRLLGSWGALWIAWGVGFYRVYRDRGMPIDRAVSWLLRGSVVELLVAVPCHIWVRRRDECSAPMVTGCGIATRIAVMLL